MHVALAQHQKARKSWPFDEEEAQSLTDSADPGSNAPQVPAGESASEFLTRDISPLSQPNGDSAASMHSSAFALECNDHQLGSVADYVRNSISENTLRAYRSDLRHFAAWGGTIPASDEMIASYLAAHGEANAIATLVRRLSSISVAHDRQGFPNPTRTPLVKATLRGIKRSRGTAHTEAKPLLKEDLFQVLAAMGDGIKDIRDRALLLIGFAGGFRRSELVAIDKSDIEPVRQGIVVHLRRSKTDQIGAGRKIGIPIGRTRCCPVAALEEWLLRAGDSEGAVFRCVDRHGSVLRDRLSGGAVSLVVKERAAAAGYDASGYSGHSLRAGFVTSAVQAGVSSWKIKQQTGHRSDAMLARYLRDDQLFHENGAGALL